MVTIFADIGGTHVRFATLICGEPDFFQKFSLSKYSNLNEALDIYEPGPEKGELWLATAAWPWPDGTWRFAREGRWVIDTRELENKGWKVKYIGNDFGAGARGALVTDELFNVQKEGKNEIVQHRAAVLGSGTGLGLAYVSNNKVHETYGGQMEIPQRTDEQHEVLKLVARLKDNERHVTAEDIVSGPGLTLLHKACLVMRDRRLEDVKPAEILENADDAEFSLTLRLYHEFLGMFAQQAVIYGHAYKALYLDGGVLHRMVERGVFDSNRFLQYFIGDPIPLIKTQLQAMPVNIVTDPYVTLRGLMEIMSDAA